MSHRTQITLEDEQYARLLAESGRTGLGLAELVRRALDSTYGSDSVEARRSALEVSFGAWSGLETSGEEYVARLRHGLGRRMARR
jgi:hypothetical protein